MSLIERALVPLFKVVSVETLVNTKSGKFISPLYHCVSDQEVPHIKNLYRSKNIETFDKELDFLLKYYKPVDFNEVKSASLNNKAFEKPSMLLTFDDGLSECANVIAPILLKKGVPAIFFINSGFVDNRDLFYRYKVSLIIEEVSKNSRKLSEIKKGVSLSKAIKSLKLLNYKDIALINDLAEKIDLSFDRYLEQNKPYMSTDEIRSLSQSGFSIGAHSVDHPYYKEMNYDFNLDQTINSLNYVCDTFNLDYRAFAFPFSDNKIPKRFFEEILDQHCDLTFGTSGSRMDIFSNSIQRIPFEQGDLSAEHILKLYLSARLIKRLTGTYTIARNN
jgi:peptidoglycan/xylan/chitin deacetylase (PgdA/CDA1 family)